MIVFKYEIKIKKMIDKNKFRGIFLKSRFLINLRTNIRKIIDLAVKNQFEKQILKSREYLKKAKLNTKERKDRNELANQRQFLLAAWSDSICYCALCHSCSKDMLFIPKAKRWYCKRHTLGIVDYEWGFKTRRHSKYIYKWDEEAELEGTIRMYLDTKKALPPEPFQINGFLTLKFEKGYKTVIYIKDKEFMQCKYLLLTLSEESVSNNLKINSIDDATEYLDSSMEQDSMMVPPDVEFWGHCSNLQA
ncbi:MAG: hypothetical protein BAJALOKI1v1_590011 [Promethearchaeota archaeon]|nr:MAG: hypothetical protein BAJALOKI1v1_590011 [Candidatus Lokiarchaeota archaeon]